MSIQLIKDVATRAMKSRGLTRADLQAIRKKYRGKVSRTKVDFVLQAYSNGIVTKQERAGLIRLFGKSKALLCVRRKVEGKNGRALRDIRRALKGIAKPNSSAKRKAQIALLRTLDSSLVTATNVCNDKKNNFISQAVVGAVIAMYGDLSIVKSAWYKLHQAVGFIEGSMKRSDKKKITALLWHKRMKIRLIALRTLEWELTVRYSKRTIGRLMHLALKDAHSGIRRSAASELCKYKTRQAVAKVIKQYDKNPSNTARPICVSTKGTGVTRPTANP